MRLLFLLFISFNALCQEKYFPGKVWSEQLPESLGLDKNKLEEAINFAVENENSVEKDLRISILNSFGREPGYRIKGPTKFRGETNGLIIKNGYIVGKWGDTKRVDMTFSVTKSYLSTVAALAHDKGLIKLDDRLQNYVWDGKFDDPHNSQITWHHLLNQSSQWSGELFGTYDWADRPPRGLSLEEIKKQRLLPPGQAYKYNDVRVNLLSFSLLNVFRKPLPVVLKENIMDPIGASSTWRWYGYDNSMVVLDGVSVQSVSGGGHFGGGLFINSIDHARFGLLFLRNGSWKGKEIISPEWINKMIIPSENNDTYGYMWWLNRGDRKWHDLSENIFYGSGFGGNYVIVVPEHELVIVARWIDSSKIGDFVKKVIEAHK
ncbi:MAG: serine hydrolase [Flammeovirgaceae bacterium]|nr:serine hydrolase [Flammeovirgaceae bacterium]|tara:strand:+ start:880 stop:2007 length:1128 start_codon:yes stop_codon:yes gene_type:complete